jgi:hypothetical protein
VVEHRFKLPYPPSPQVWLGIDVRLRKFGIYSNFTKCPKEIKESKERKARLFIDKNKRDFQKMKGQVE